LAKNQQMLAQSDMLLLSGHKDSRYYERASEVKFMLAVDPKLPWVAELAR